MRLDNEEERNFYLTEVANEYWSVKEENKIIEKDVENAIISHLQKFLLEMGKGFCFVDRQTHTSI